MVYYIQEMTPGASSDLALLLCYKAVVSRESVHTPVPARFSILYWLGNTLFNCRIIMNKKLSSSVNLERIHAVAQLNTDLSFRKLITWKEAEHRTSSLLLMSNRHAGLGQVFRDYSWNTSRRQSERRKPRDSSGQPDKYWGNACLRPPAPPPAMEMVDFWPVSRGGKIFSESALSHVP